MSKVTDNERLKSAKFKKMMEEQERERDQSCQHENDYDINFNIYVRDGHYRELNFNEPREEL